MISTARALGLVAVAFLVGCATTDLPQKDDWLVLRGDGTPPEIVLVRERLPGEAVRSRFPVLLRITWSYESLPDGLPTEDELKRGRELYAALDQIIGRDGVYAMSRTIAGARSMYYYVKTPTAHSEELRRYFYSLPSVSVRITARTEPDWDSVRKVLDGTRH